MKLSREEAWAGTLESMVDNRVVFYLRRYNRDYLGHVAEEMTKQYVDYMPKKIEKANDNYFDKPENNIALTITPKKRRYRHEKG